MTGLEIVFGRGEFPLSFCSRSAEPRRLLSGCISLTFLLASVANAQEDSPSLADTFVATSVQRVFGSFRGSEVAYEQTRDGKPFASCRVWVCSDAAGRFFRSQKKRNSDVEATLVSILLEEHLLHSDGMYLRTQRIKPLKGTARGGVVFAKRSWKNQNLALVDTIPFGLVWDGKQNIDVTDRLFWSELSKTASEESKIVGSNDYGVTFEFIAREGPHGLADLVIDIHYNAEDDNAEDAKSRILRETVDFAFDTEGKVTGWNIRDEWLYKGINVERNETATVSSWKEWPIDDQVLQFKETEVDDGEVVFLKESKEIRYEYHGGRFREAVDRKP